MQVTSQLIKIVFKLMLLLNFCSSDVFAQKDTMASPKPPLKDAQDTAQYQNCPSGRYNGPTPGKARYTKDKFIWVVTPEFAARFCMPPEFVSNELKGAEAVAFKIVENLDEESCGWGGREEVCAAEKELRFEIYYKTGLIPKKNQVMQFEWPNSSSRLLIGKSKLEWDAIKERAAKNRVDKTFHEVPFSNQFGLLGVDDKQVIWPIVSLSQRAYFQGHAIGIDYLSIQGSTGFFSNPRMEKLGVKKFVIAVRKPNENKHDINRPLTDFAHIIEFPESFIDKVRLADKTRGSNIEALGRAAFGLPAIPAAASSGPSKP
jgi:hypothetical protein